jgi:hypothetical protein
MTIQRLSKLFVLVTVLATAITACGGGGGGSSGGGSDVGGPVDPPPAAPPPVAESVDFNQTVVGLLSEGSVTLPDGETYDMESAAIQMSAFDWEINSDVDFTGFDDVFEQ